MKPTNIRKAIDPGDGAGLRCHFMAKCDPPQCWSRCETDSTVTLTNAELIDFWEWEEQNPKAIIKLYPFLNATLCDTHEQTIKECQPYD